MILEQLIQVADVLEWVGIAITTLIAPIVFWQDRSVAKLANKIFMEKRRDNPNYRMANAKKEAERRIKKRTYILIVVWVIGVAILILGKGAKIIGGK